MRVGGGCRRGGGGLAWDGCRRGGAQRDGQVRVRNGRTVVGKRALEEVLVVAPLVAQPAAALVAVSGEVVHRAKPGDGNGRECLLHFTAPVATDSEPPAVRRLAQVLVDDVAAARVTLARLATLDRQTARGGADGAAALGALDAEPCSRQEQGVEGVGVVVRSTGALGTRVGPLME